MAVYTSLRMPFNIFGYRYNFFFCFPPVKIMRFGRASLSAPAKMCRFERKKSKKKKKLLPDQAVDRTPKHDHQTNRPDTFFFLTSQSYSKLWLSSKKVRLCTWSWLMVNVAQRDSSLEMFRVLSGSYQISTQTLFARSGLVCGFKIAVWVMISSKSRFAIWVGF